MNAKPIQLIVLCIAFITLTALGMGAWLSYCDKEGSNILFTTAASGLGGLGALLSSTRPMPETNAEGATKVEVQNTKENPVPTTEETKPKDKTTK